MEQFRGRRMMRNFLDDIKRRKNVHKRHQCGRDLSGLLLDSRNFNFSETLRITDCTASSSDTKVVTELSSKLVLKCDVFYKKI